MILGTENIRPHDEKLRDLIILAFQPSRLRWTRHATRLGEVINMLGNGHCENRVGGRMIPLNLMY
jgi:hypothetical protein